MSFILDWDAVGEKVYQSGIDRGVLYVGADGVNYGQPWNGLVSVEDNTTEELKSYYLDGQKILDHVVPSDFQGRLSAFTYPEILDFYHRGQGPGYASESIGLSFHDQPYKTFDLSYRTKIGNDQDEDFGYKIHILYNVTAIPEGRVFETLGQEANANLFSWSLVGRPTITDVFGLSGVKPTAHVSIDSRTTDPELLTELETILYGVGQDLEAEPPIWSVEARCPSVNELRVLFGFITPLTITDNGDGTWTASEGFSQNNFIKMIDSETFEIKHADATYLDEPGGDPVPDYSSEYYTITDTPLPLG